ncbi:DUF4276 family protein [Candidatus Magnetominusculus xianensis]|uniref:DUF4276 family protein n=1 Tax=Candidatus Magnetominusculus xianensis TaxID=1748249 RepID=A0ABR5SIJ4_9BACT|nr:DUF4276 family protein [Candidatus Magnetominusculus xianensis]KWT92698.1 hypothetical protein ASN18_0529 [Candidatus Magnetominusculus xianensis]MBF0403751.1 DUF4276 family protein [Nitrospirota bacterium]
MNEITYTLLSDGTADRRLIPILTWLLHQHCPDKAVEAKYADFRNMPKQKDLGKKIEMAMVNYPSMILFIHRDAEGDTYDNRVSEIRKDIKNISAKYKGRQTVCVVPVRMTEAWLLFDETAIRLAAGNKNDRVVLDLPYLKTIEDKPNLTDVLEKLLIVASGNTRGRKLKQFKRDISEKAFKVAENIEDFSPLRKLSAFQHLEEELTAALRKMKLI